MKTGNPRYEYLNDPQEIEGLEYDTPCLYDKKVDVIYPNIYTKPNDHIIFDDFMHGRKLYLKRQPDGFVDLSEVYTEVIKLEPVE